jgi:hypothetical protein
MSLDDVKSDVILQHLSQQSIDRAATSGDPLQNAAAFHLVHESALSGVDLTPKATSRWTGAWTTGTRRDLRPLRARIAARSDRAS